MQKNTAMKDPLLVIISFQQYLCKFDKCTCFSIHHIYLECQVDPLTPLFFVRGLLMQYFAINLIVCAAFFAHIAHYWPMKPEAFCWVCKCKAQNVGPLELTMLGLCDKWPQWWWESENLTANDLYCVAFCWLWRGDNLCQSRRRESSKQPAPSDLWLPPSRGGMPNHGQ